MKLKFAMWMTGLLMVSGWSVCHCQSAEGTTSAAGQFNILNRQISTVQNILTELSRSLSETVSTGTRAVSANTESLTSSFTPIISQLSALQHALNTVAVQAQRIVDSGSRVITGQPLAYFDSEGAADATASTSAPVTSGSAITAPAEVFTRTVSTATRQLGQVTQVVEQLSKQMSNMLTTGARTLAINRLNPTDSVLEVMEDYVNQISQIQKSLRSANNQLNRLLENGPFSSGNGLHREKRADTMVITGLQKAATELTREIGQIGGTLARIAGGVSGVPIPGAESDTRGADSSLAAFQGLNPVGVISRGVGNLASSLSRIMPGRK